MVAAWTCDEIKCKSTEKINLQIKVFLFFMVGKVFYFKSFSTCFKISHKEKCLKKMQSLKKVLNFN